ncbi:aldehyde dehydrogenase (NADP(+)) [Curtobacterium ammoniigenes]|uniref:aldehyde dehydrogenase (NADP(+)) n=1 Tax=Curtobacterium ammoniigenes TaxID=395387 RepID=UPI00082EA501|nr:aldehyde dehydrogenase (NADP(+)) [Curtobacterium ammoniigenes]
MTTAPQEIETIALAAATAAPLLAGTPASDRAVWLRAIADELDANTDELVAIADKETHLGVARLTGEVGRTTGQLRLFATAIEEGAYAEAIIDHAAPGATPPRPDLRRMLRPLGPVAVFSASNFPFAFSVAGGDTASALAAGCPVVVKAHGAHEELSHRTAELVASALQAAGAPDGTFGIVFGREAGQRLVQHPAIKAAGFTGSVAGGRALYDLAGARPDPIPFYGELGSINPVVVTRAAAEQRLAELAAGLVGSFTLGVGQYCTKPGLVFVPAASGFDDAVVAALQARADAGNTNAEQMLTPGMAEAFAAGLSGIAAVPGVDVLWGSSAQQNDGDARAAVLLATDVPTALGAEDVLFEECFGPVTLLIRYRDEDELRQALAGVEGSLTGTIHAQPGDDLAQIVALLADRVGRILFGGWPTGVAVTWSQQHGGPWPATTSTHTSVGVTAMRRFQRPIAFQDAPAEVLPAELREDNPLRIPRRVDGVLMVP